MSPWLGDSIPFSFRLTHLSEREHLLIDQEQELLKKKDCPGNTGKCGHAIFDNQTGISDPYLHCTARKTVLKTLCPESYLGSGTSRIPKPGLTGRLLFCSPLFPAIPAVPQIIYRNRPFCGHDCKVGLNVWGKGSSMALCAPDSLCGCSVSNLECTLQDLRPQGGAPS